MSSNSECTSSRFAFVAILLAAFFVLPLQAGFAPDAGSGGSQTSAFLNISGPIVVQPCANITLSGSMINASNVSQTLASYNITVVYNSTHNSSANITGVFTLNITAPCTTRGLAGNFALDNLTVYTNSSDNHSRTLRFFVSNATNVSVVILSQKPPFARSTNNTVNVTYFNGSTALANNIPYLRVYNTQGQIETADIALYNLSARTNAQGVIQYNISVSSTASGAYALVVDYGLANFVFKTQSAMGLSFISQTTSGESRVSFAPRSAVNLIVKSRYANGTAYDLIAGEYITAFITLPNNTVAEVNLTAIDASTNPGANNVTFRNTFLPGDYKVRIVGRIQGDAYETLGKFEVRGGLARLQAGDDFFQHVGDRSVILPGQTVRFNVLLYNNSDDSLVAGTSNGAGNTLACDSIVLSGFTNLATGLNTSWTGVFSTGVVQYAGSTNICAINIGVPATSGDYRINAILVDPTNSSLRIPAEGIVAVREYRLSTRPCPGAVGEISSCGQMPIFEKDGNVSFDIEVINFTSGSSLARSAILNVTGIVVRKFSFGIGAASELTNWVENASYYIQYPQYSGNVLRVVLDLPNDGTTGPREVMLTVNTTVGVLTGSNGFMVKSSTIEAHGGPSNGQGGFNPQISCNGTFAFFLEAFDMRTMQSVQGVSVQGVRAVRHVISGKVLDSTFITGVTTNTTDSSGSATYNVTFNTSKSFMPGPYDMILNVSYQGTEDEAFSGFMCGSGSFELFKPEGFRPPGGEGAGPQQGGREFQGGITGFPFGMPPRSGATDTVRLSFQGLGFGGQGFQGGQQGNPGASLINGTLKVTSIRYSNRDTNTERSIAATGNLVYNVTTSAAAVTLEPANFSLLSWPQGFMRLMVNLTNGSTPGIGTQPSALGQLPGFESSPYRVDFAEMPALPESVAVGQNVSILVNASTNVSTSGNNVTIRAQSMTSNTQVRTTLVSAVKVLDGWNSSADEIGFSPGAETWNVTFTVPTMDVGQINFVVVVNNSRSVTNELMARTRISSLEVRPLSGYIMQMHARCAVRDDATENGTMFNCFPLTMGGGPGQPFDPAEPSITSRLNFSVINTTYNVSSKSGNLCYKPALNYSGGMQGISFDNPFSLTNTTYVAVIDNLTAGVYDTLVFNNSGGNFTVMTLSNTSSSHRGFARFNSSYSGLYVTMLEGCFAVKLAKGDENPMDEQGIIRLGRNAVNQNFYLAYRVFNGGQKVTNAYVDLMGVGNMSLDGTQFVNLLPASQYRTRGSYSDNNGVAFVQANVSTAGERMLLWKVNGTANGQFVQAFAKIQRDPTAYGGGGGNMVTIASFNAFCNGFNPQITQANQNLSLTCQTMYLNDSNMGGVNITMFAESWGVRTALTMYNATTGAIQSGFLTDAMGSVQFNYTMPGGWLPNRFYRLSGLAVLGDLNQQFDTGGVSFGGGSGQWGGPMGQGGP